jgi:uncharacterized protein (DUF427 family)
VIEESPRWVRGRLGGETVVDSRRVVADTTEANALFETGLPVRW